ncbi:hypothetical protein BS78_07G191700 [Paspalum vaginatum]|nr:hypothetical protein BS78_07G191700 [Paspalum vaginatum]
MLGRPQEGNEVVLLMGIWIDLVTWLPFITPIFTGILPLVLLILMSKMQLRGASQLTSRARGCRRLQLWAVLTAFLIIYALCLMEAWAEGHLNISLIPMFIRGEGYNYYQTPAFDLACASAEILSQVVAVLLLIFRPQIVANLTNNHWGRWLLPLAKVISALGLAFGSAVAVWPPALSSGNQVVDPSSFIIAFTVAVLSLGSIQTPAAANNLFVGCWIDVILHILFLWFSMITTPAGLYRDLLGPRLFTSLAAGTTSVLLVAVLLIGNLQFPAAVVQVLISSSRLEHLQFDYHQPQEGSISPNMLPAIKVFYVLALCQGSLYIMASILGLFSFFPRRSLVFQSQFRGQRGAKAIDLYYEWSYAACMETGLFAAKKTMSLARFAVDSLNSNSGAIRLAAVIVLGNLLHQRETDYSRQELRSKIMRSNKKLSTLVGMLGWADVRHRYVRLTAAKVIASLADILTIAEIPGMLKSVSSLLDADNQPATNEQGRHDEETSVQTPSAKRGNAGSQDTNEQLEHVQENNGGYCNWACWCWQRMKEKWSVLEELPLTYQDSLPIMGMVILERLAHDPDNCAEIIKAPCLISKPITLISYTTYSESSNDEQQHAICSSLNFVRRLAITGESIGVELRQELCKNPFLLNNLECVLEDSHVSPEVMKLVIDILAKLALDEDARKEIGSSKVTICKLMHTFIGRDGDGLVNSYYDQLLRMAAGEALAILTMESPANCLAVLEEPGYELIKDLKNMLCEDEHRYVAASLLENVCAHSVDKLRHQGASDHLSSAFPIVMENVMSAGGKQLESLIGLLSQICDVIREPYVLDLQLQTNGSGLVQKLVGTLNSNRKPNPEYPRMRRVIVELVISIVKFCPRYATIFREAGMMEALTKVERTPSKVENYRVFYGNIGVVREGGSSLTALVATAKELIHSVLN